MRLCSVFTVLVVLAPVARVLAQSPANLVTVSFNFFNVPATFQVTFEDDLGDRFNSATFTQLNNPGVACNVGLGGGWVFSALEWQSVPINLYNTELGYQGECTLSANSASEGTWFCNTVGNT
ncbi:hypothetical protein F5879DRAFT_985596 [Lentinula edodes]|nr:hypothetical protein F5879DRAFT_985596 [Lentinula edodes]KAJ3924039.1 hypothetical protein F5877DRAFT_73733 [Lentinula edodes]